MNGLLDFFTGGQDAQDVQQPATGFLGSPQSMALAAALLQGGAYSPRPISLGEALGNGMQAMQKQTSNDVKNQYTKALTQQLQQTMLLKQRQQQAAQAYFGGSQSQPQSQTTAAEPQTQNTDPMLFMQPGAESQQAAQQPQSQNGAASPAVTPGLLFAMGMPEKAAELMMRQGGEYGRPQSVLGADGKPKLIQTDKYGHTREVQGYLPAPKSQMGITIDPATGQIVFAQGAGVLPDGWLKDPKMGPSRGGQGGTFTDPKTGQVISSDTSKMTSQDQQTIAAMERVEPQIERIVNTLPQFQHADVKAQSYLQGLGNKFFGTDYRLPSQQAEGQAALNSAPESLLKALGLNVTDQSMNMVKGIIEPMPGESPDGFKDRIKNQLGELRQFQGQSKNRLANGIVVKNGNTQASPAVQNATSVAPTFDYHYVPGKGLINANR